MAFSQSTLLSCWNLVILETTVGRLGQGVALNLCHFYGEGAGVGGPGSDHRQHDRRVRRQTHVNVHWVALYGSVRSFNIISSTFPPFTDLTVLATVSATNCGEGGAAAGDVELVIHARVVRRLRPRQHKVLHVQSANQMGKVGTGRSSRRHLFLVVLRPIFSSYGSCKDVLCAERLPV